MSEKTISIPVRDAQFIKDWEEYNLYMKEFLEANEFACPRTFRNQYGYYIIVSIENGIEKWSKVMSEDE